MIRNEKLKKNLEALTQSAFSIYEQKLELDERLENDPRYLTFALPSLDNMVGEIPEFQACVRLMEEDSTMKSLLGELVGTYNSRFLVRDGETCILSFIKQLYRDNKEYEQRLFEQQYLAFEDFFYLDTIHLRESTHLYNFDFDGSEIELDKGLKIVVDRSSKTLPLQGNYSNSLILYTTFSQSKFLIERNYETKKIVGEDHETEKINWESTPQNKTNAFFDNVIRALRILKSSAVYRDHNVTSESLAFSPWGGGVSTQAWFLENTTIGEKCKVEEKDVAELHKIFKFITEEKDNRFAVAYRRLSGAVERRLPEDRLIDYMIGLEALYLPDGNAELSFRISLRLAFLMYSEASDRKEAFQFMREMYETRSKIVHGSEYDLKNEDILKVEELLRGSVKLWIEDKNNFSVNKFTNSGNLKTEGKLDNIFFDA